MKKISIEITEKYRSVEVTETITNGHVIEIKALRDVTTKNGIKKVQDVKFELDNDFGNVITIGLFEDNSYYKKLKKGIQYAIQNLYLSP